MGLSCEWGGHKDPRRACLGGNAKKRSSRKHLKGMSRSGAALFTGDASGDSE